MERRKPSAVGPTTFSGWKRNHERTAPVNSGQLRRIIDLAERRLGYKNRGHREIITG